MIATTLFALLLAAPETSAADAPDPKDQLVCKREVPIGSLIASRKVCLTKSQWEARAKNGNEEARKQVYDNAGRPACNFNGGGDC
jgi:hypothetical protein